MVDTEVERAMERIVAKLDLIDRKSEMIEARVRELMAENEQLRRQAKFVKELADFGQRALVGRWWENEEVREFDDARIQHLYCCGVSAPWPADHKPGCNVEALLDALPSWSEQ